jgi:hypothetical protein
MTTFTESDWNRLKELDALADERLTTPAEDQERCRLGYRLCLAASLKIGIKREEFHARNRHSADVYDRAVRAGVQDLAAVIAAGIAAEIALNPEISETEWRAGTESFYSEVFSLDEINSAITEIKRVGLWPNCWMSDSETRQQ